MEQNQTSNHEEIARLASDLWQTEGRQSGRDLEYWLRAEQQLAAKSKPEALKRNSTSKSRVSVSGAKR
jgi:hypothetical protein